MNVLIENENLYTYEYFLQENVCRLCWNLDAEKNIFECEAQEIKLENTILDKIHDILSLNLTKRTEDIYPKKLCESCYEQIDKFYKFKSFCLETDQKLRNILDNADIKPHLRHKTVKLEDIDGNSDADTFYNLPENDSHSNYSNKPLKKKLTRKPTKTNKYKPKRCPTYCNICRKDLFTIQDYTVHLSELHGVEDNVYRCFGCDKRFVSSRNRLGHELRHCKGLKNGYKCMKCDRYLPSRRLYESHARDHRDNVTDSLPEKLFKCSKCGEKFDCKEELSCHFIEHDDGVKKFVCESCGRAFSRRDYLHKHLLTHSGVKHHVCPHCGYRAAQKSSLNMHLRKHTGERPFSCDMCPQRCVSSSNLRAHRLRHFGGKKYECAICSKKFGYKLSLEEHIGSAHERSRSNVCTDCGATYTRARGLRRHRLAKHGAKKEGKVDSTKDVCVENNYNEK